ncbi:MAG: outer membrane beta-barrel protein [Gemmatimonadota bacterium]
MLGMAGAALGLAAAPLRAQGLEQYDYANLGFRGIGATVSFVDASQVDGTAAFGGRVDLGFLGPYIRVVPRFSFWSADVEQSEVTNLASRLEDVAGLARGTIDLGAIERDVVIGGVDFQWTLPNAVVAPYIGLGADVYVLNDSGQAIQNTFLDDAVVTAGVSAVAGLEVPLDGHWRLSGDVRGTLVTDVSNVAIGGGVSYYFRDR